MKYRVFLDASMYPTIDNSDAFPAFNYVFYHGKRLPRGRLVSDLYRTIVDYEFKYLL